MKVKALILAGVLALGGLVGLSAPAYADVECPAGTYWGDKDGGVNKHKPTYAECNLPETDESLMETAIRIINVVVGVVAFVAVAVIIVGGVFYVISTGEAAKIARAKNTILYGIVGLVISLLAFAIVNFVVKNIFGTPSTPAGAGDSGTSADAGSGGD